MPVVSLCGKSLIIYEGDEEDEDDEDITTECILEEGHQGFHFDGDFWFNDRGIVQEYQCQDKNRQNVQRRHRNNHICRYH